MKILIKQFLSANHSWAHIGKAIAKELILSNNQVDLFSTDGKTIDSTLQQYLIGNSELNKNITYGRDPDKNYDLAISYTAPHNWKNYLKYGDKKLAIWCYEFIGRDNKDTLPMGFGSNHVYCDQILAPSNFARQIFLNGGVPENKVMVVPHGIGKEYLGTSKVNLPTRKTFKILANIAQNHKRKNLQGLLKVYGRAFNKKDDVCLILKGKDKPVEAPFEVSLKTCLKNFREKYPNHAEVKIIDYYIDDISALYRSIDCVFSMTRAECWYLPGSEALLSGKLNIVPNWGGQLEFLNNDNALLIDGKEEIADPTAMYWESKPNAIWFSPSIDDATEKLRYAKNNYIDLNKKLEEQKIENYNKFSWKTIVNKIEKL